MATVKPDFFIVGAPKCGTSALDGLLGLHPQVLTARRKDTGFLCTDLLDSSVRPTAEKHAALFSGYAGEKRVGESSVLYLYSDEAAGAIQAMPRATQAIVMVRNPLEMVQSYHSQLLKVGAEDLKELGGAWAASDQRRKGMRLPQGLHLHPSLLDYKNIARYSVGIARFRRAVGPARVFVGLLDELASRPRHFLDRIFEFLDVARIAGSLPLERILGDPRRLNRRAVTRSPALGKLVRSPTPYLRRLVRMMIPWQRARLEISERILRWNERLSTPRGIEADLEREIIASYMSEIHTMEAMLGRDLSSWRGDGVTPASRR